MAALSERHFGQVSSAVVQVPTERGHLLLDYSTAAAERSGILPSLEDVPKLGLGTDAPPSTASAALSGKMQRLHTVGVPRSATGDVGASGFHGKGKASDGAGV